MSSSSAVKYQPLSTSPEEYEDNEVDLDETDDPQSHGPSTSRRWSRHSIGFLGLLDRRGDQSLSVSTAPVTPASSDGVFSNIPAKPTSSNDEDGDEEEMGADEWIFMTPEQRKKLPPPVSEN